MSKTALFIRHQAQPGRRDDVQRIWERHVKPRVEANPAHEAYYFCHDSADPDVICVFQLYSSEESMREFLSGSWYPGYLSEVAQVVAARPQISPATLVWNKSPGVSGPGGGSPERKEAQQPPGSSNQSDGAT